MDIKIKMGFRNKLRHTKRYILDKPYFFVLILILLIISALNIKQGYALLGWDNYSSFLNVNSNTIRTFFSTWREYRGLGVPSDAEVTDIWRMLYYVIGQHIMPNYLLEQVYYLLALNIGMITMYKLAGYIFTKINKNESLTQHVDLIGFVASIFYLFNINTLSVFSFPILMFVSRFCTFPIIIYIFLRLINESVGVRKTLLYMILLLVSSVTFIVPTIFITLMMVLVLIVLSHWRKLKRGIGVLLLFILINSYWLFPFVNYTIQKSDDVALASTFVRINEDLLNRNESYYSPTRSLLLIPQFYDMRYAESSTGQEKMFHPLFIRYATASFSFEKVLLWLFPALYIIGSGLLIYKGIRRSQLLWIPGVILGFVLLSMKEFRPLGFVYTFLAKTIPLFDVIFRFGDTKFHSIIALAGSLAAAYVFVSGGVWIGKRIRSEYKKYFIHILALLIFVSSIYVFREYVTGQLIGFQIYNKVPNAYYEISDYINKDPRSGRVVHLPMDQTGYWKSYAWGYNGSAFLQFMLEKPLIDKTFEPASIENWALIEGIYSLQDNIQSIEKATDSAQRVQVMYDLLNKFGVRYVILDDSISSRIGVRGIDVRGSTNYSNSRKILELMEEQGLVEKKLSKDIDLTSYDFETRYPYIKPIDIKNPTQITLYELVDIAPQIEFIPEITETQDSISWEIIAQNGISSLGHTIQRASSHAMLFPFIGNRNNYVQTDGRLTVSVPTSDAQVGDYAYRIIGEDLLPEKDHLIEVVASRNKDILTLQLYGVDVPVYGTISQNTLISTQEFTIDEDEFESGEKRSSQELISNSRIMKQNVMGHYKIRMNGNIIHIPQDTSNTPRSIGAVMIDTSSIEFELLARNGRQIVETGSFTMLSSEACYKDQHVDFSNTTIVPNQQEITLATRNGSSCMMSARIPFDSDKESVYGELHFLAQGESIDLDGNYHYGANTIGSKPLLDAAIKQLEKPNYLFACVRERSVGYCRMPSGIHLGLKQQYVAPIGVDISTMDEPVVYVELRTSGYQEISAKLSSIYVDTYRIEEKDTVEIPPIVLTQKITILAKEKLALSFPVDQSDQSYYSSFGRMVPLHDMIPSPDYRTIRFIDDSRLVSYIDNVANGLTTSLPYSSDHMYLWTLNYNLASGQYPFFGIEDEVRLLAYDQVSMWQGYPDIKGFKIFQSPEIFTSEEKVTNTLHALKTQQAYQLVMPEKGLNDRKDKFFKIAQSTENEGLMVLDSMNILNIPNYWGNLALVPQAGATTTYSKPNAVTYERIIPSLVRVELKTEKAGLMLFKFNEGYDIQWGIYHSLKQLIMGTATTNAIRCDGYANCFEIDTQPGTNSFYIFYWPERLATIGWVVTLIVGIGAGLALGRKRP